MNAVIYTRVSTEEQAKGYSLQTQLERCREYAQFHGYTVIAEREDRHSGENLERAGLNSLIELASRTVVHALIAFDTDRLSRGGPAHHAIIEIQLEKCGTKIEYVLGDYNNDSPESGLSTMIKQSISWYENKQRRERIVRGRNAKIKSGKVIVGARPPYGYTYSNGELHIEPDEAQVVKKIYRLLREGESTRAIARKLHEEAIPTRGDKYAPIRKNNDYSIWNPSSIKKILKNETYTGVWYFGKTQFTKVNGKKKQVKLPKSEWMVVEVPQIIDKLVFRESQRILGDNQAKSKRNTKREYLLQGMVYCSCGLCCACSYRRELNYYRCPIKGGHTWERSCATKFHVRSDVIENLVWNTVVNLLLNPEYLKVEIDRQRQKAEQESTGLRSQFEAVSSAISDTERKIGILIDQMLDNDLPKSILDERKQMYVQKLKLLESEKSQLEVIISAGTITPTQEEALNQLATAVKEKIAEVSFEQKRKTLQVLRIRVDVCDKRKIKFSSILPIPDEPVDVDEFAATSFC